MKEIKQINATKQLELHEKYGHLIRELISSCLILKNSSFTKCIKFQYQIEYFFNANIEFEIHRCDNCMKLLDFCIYFSGYKIEDKFKGSCNFSKYEIEDIEILCLNIAEFIDDVIGKNK